MVNNDYDKFISFSRLYMTLFRHRTCIYFHGRADRCLVSVSNGQAAALRDWAYYQKALFLLNPVGSVALLTIAASVSIVLAEYLLEGVWSSEVAAGTGEPTCSASTVDVTSYERCAHTYPVCKVTLHQNKVVL